MTLTPLIRLCETLANNQELARKFDELERRVTHKLESHDQAIVGILKAIRELMTPPEPSRRPIGFVTHE